MLLVSPMTSRAHYLILILPSLLICRAAIIDGDRFFRWLLPVLLVCGPLVTKGLIGKTLGDLALAWSLPTWYAIACLAGMWRLMARGRAARRAPVAEFVRIPESIRVPLPACPAVLGQPWDSLLDEPAVAPIATPELNTSASG
jgi:hypothetical protein